MRSEPPVVGAPDDRFLSERHAGELVDMSAKSIRRLRESGALSTYWVRGSVRVSEKELLEYVRGQRVDKVEAKTDLKSMLKSISDRVLANRNK
jgi:hypothetical protein